MSLKDVTAESIAAPKVSIVIPAYNAMTYLPDTLASVFQQTFYDFEVLLVDDGSTDSIQTWVAQTVFDRRVKLISQPNQGLSAARNTGITHSQSEYIAFLDADDLWHPTKLAQQVQWLDAHPTLGLIYNQTAQIDSAGTPTGRVLGSAISGNIWPQMLQRNIIDCPSSVLVRRQCFDRVGLFDRTLRSVEDWDMWIRIAAIYPVAVICQPLVYYRQHPSNMSKNWRVMEQSFDRVITKAFAAAPPELQALKPQSLGSAALVLAWKALQSQDRDCQLARKFQQRAIDRNPKLRISSENLRLTIAILALKWLGAERYSRFLSIAYAVRRRRSGITA
ncbi:glycosyltransferase family 2 protein [Chamaesiphon minutus]|uniref:Glycosyl transferase n=1 Tax=Chamaesiphon minutus (strain ATCC 27169 / PCC 6605) TaxID=1173020 RepID=K9UC22_CHAP6|nr:glycosyltransferase family A protein [Chamaesiphon minutus]AFY92662.1 glycosyl transferase [Chamaesiphon minutus PCC 6605]